MSRTRHEDHDGLVSTLPRYSNICNSNSSREERGISLVSKHTKYDRQTEVGTQLFQGKT